MFCLDGGTLQLCDSCLVSYHEECYTPSGMETAGTDGEPLQRCAAHACWSCPAGTPPGGPIFACMSCPRAFCGAHVPRVANTVPRKKLRLPFTPERTTYIHCSDACGSVSRGIRHGKLFQRGQRTVFRHGCWWIDAARRYEGAGKTPPAREQAVLAAPIRLSLFRLDPAASSSSSDAGVSKEVARARARALALDRERARVAREEKQAEQAKQARLEKLAKNAHFLAGVAVAASGTARLSSPVRAGAGAGAGAGADGAPKRAMATVSELAPPTKRQRS